jgi:hypothetical protein
VTLRRKVDGRSAEARRFRRRFLDLAGDLGGESSLTEAERALVRQAAVMTIRADEAQATLLAGERVETDELVRLSNACARLLSALGVQRRKRQPAHIPPWKSQ